MNNYYLDEKLMEYHKTELIAQAQRDALVRELKQAGKPRTKTGSRKRENSLKFNWFFGPKSHSTSPIN